MRTADADRSSSGQSRPDGAAAFDVQIESENGGIRVAVSGALDIAASDRVWEAIEPALRGADAITFDLSNASFIDSTGLSTMIRAYKCLGQRKEAVIIRRPGRAARRVIELSGFDQLVTIEGLDGTAPHLDGTAPHLDGTAPHLDGTAPRSESA
jgi:anti-sigma B factor antagonist